MNRDGRNDDDADWLLAQLANGQQPARQEPPVAPPAFPVPPVRMPRREPVAPTASRFPCRWPPQPPAPRREEVLDWFSLAEPPAAPDAATRALPVIGGPLAPSEGTPAVPQSPALPGEPPPHRPSPPADTRRGIRRSPSDAPTARRARLLTADLGRAARRVGAADVRGRGQSRPAAGRAARAARTPAAARPCRRPQRPCRRPPLRRRRPVR